MFGSVVLLSWGSNSILLILIEPCSARRGNNVKVKNFNGDHAMPGFDGQSRILQYWSAVRASLGKAETFPRSCSYISTTTLATRHPW